MRSETVFCLFFTVVLGLFCQQKSLAQKYLRIPLVGGGSVRIIAKTVVSKPKNKDHYKKPRHSIQFQRKGKLMRIRVIEINKDNYLKKLSPSSYPKALIEYTQKYYAPIDSTCIVFDTIQTGQFKQLYPFVDLLQIDEFDHTYSKCKKGELNYSSIKERLLVVDQYLYILSVQVVLNCQSKDSGITYTRKAVQNDFRRLVRSMRVYSKKTQFKSKLKKS